MLLSDHRKPIYPPALIHELKPPNFKVFKHIPESNYHYDPGPRYKPHIGFKINFDYIINILKKEYSDMQLIYGVYSKNKWLLEP